MSAQAARNIDPDDDRGTGRRPTRAGVSTPSGAAPARRVNRRLALVTDEDFEFETVAPKPKAKAKVAEPKASPAPTRGSAALKPEAAPAAAPRERAEPLRLAPPAPVTVARMPFVILILALIVGGIVGLMLLQTQITNDGYTLQKLRDDQQRLDTAEQQLNQELAVKEAPGNVNAEAQRLGMVPAGTPAFITLPDGRIIGVPQPARGR